MSHEPFFLLAFVFWILTGLGLWRTHRENRALKNALKAKPAEAKAEAPKPKPREYHLETIANIASGAISLDLYTENRPGMFVTQSMEIDGRCHLCELSPLAARSVARMLVVAADAIDPPKPAPSVQASDASGESAESKVVKP